MKKTTTAAKARKARLSKIGRVAAEYTAKLRSERNAATMTAEPAKSVAAESVESGRSVLWTLSSL